MQATVTLRCILNKSVDHRSRTLASSEKVVSKVLPATWKWKESIPELNIVNCAFGLKEVSLSNLSKIRKLNFSKYVAKKLRDNFACCSICNRLHSLRKAAISSSQVQVLWAYRLKLHLNYAWAHQELYYANCYCLRFFLSECMTIIHDKMDHAKTTSLVILHKTKQLDGLMKLSVSITRMLAHGHGDGHYAHYGLDVFVHDLNYSVDSLAKLLRDLEMPQKSSSHQLFDRSRSTSLFEAMLHGAEMCKTSLPPLSKRHQFHLLHCFQI
jgi:hypothetical protein